MDRRTFLTGALVTGAAAVVPQIVSAHDTWREPPQPELGKPLLLAWTGDELRQQVMHSFCSNTPLNIRNADNKMLIRVARYPKMRDASAFGSRVAGQLKWDAHFTNAMEEAVDPIAAVNALVDRVRDDVWLTVRNEPTLIFEDDPYTHLGVHTNNAFVRPTDDAWREAGQYYKVMGLAPLRGDYAAMVGVYDFDRDQEYASRYMHFVTTVEELEESQLTIDEWYNALIDFGLSELPHHYQRYVNDPDGSPVIGLMEHLPVAAHFTREWRGGPDMWWR